LHNWRWKNAVNPQFLRKRTSETRGYRLTVVRYQIRAALAKFAAVMRVKERPGFPIQRRHPLVKG
jgi:hypothetical protein